MREMVFAHTPEDDWVLVSDTGNPERDQLWDVTQIAAYLQIAESTARTWLKTGRIQGFRLNGTGHWRARSSDVKRLTVSPD